VNEAGLAAQRTRLAWRRTVVSAAAVTLLAVRPALTGRAGAFQLLAAAAALGGWAVLVVAARRRDHGLAGRAPATTGWSAPGLAAATVAYAVLAVLLVLV
jgi:uncharacterized protein DUF202